jgi:DNA-directed RNA polymerase I, II, and III subunit RPABC1
MIKKYEEPPRKDGSIPEPMCGRLWVEFNSDENVGMKQIRQFMHHLVAEQFFSGILVCVKPLTGMGIKALRGMQAMEEGPRGGCEVFVEQDLLINVTKHELVPKHVVLSREEKAQLLLKYRLKETQLPRIQVTDPVAKYLGLRRGQVVKIIRKSETAGRYATYRWAI